MTVAILCLACLFVLLNAAMAYWASREKPRLYRSAIVVVGAVAVLLQLLQYYQSEHGKEASKPRLVLDSSREVASAGSYATIWSYRVNNQISNIKVSVRLRFDSAVDSVKASVIAESPGGRGETRLRPTLDVDRMGFSASAEYSLSTTSLVVIVWSKSKVRIVEGSLNP